MVPWVETPEIVRYYAPYFASAFSPEAFCQFQSYVSGLIVSENKTVDGINRISVHDVRNQSSLNRLLTETPFSIDHLHRARLNMLGSMPGTRLKPKGVFSLDDTLLTHYGQHLEKIVKLFDHTTNAYVWAHNLVNLHYSDDDTDYPISFQLWEPSDVDALEVGLKAAGIRLRECKYALKETKPRKWRSYLLGVLATQSNNPTGAKPEFCVSYVGTLSGSDERVVDKGTLPLSEFDTHLIERHQHALSENKKPLFKPTTISYKGEEKTYYSYCRTHRIKSFGKLG